jgi:uncharacterized protein (TIGR00369 family)
MPKLFASTAQTLLTTLDIEITEATKDRVVATMPVGPKVHQPFGLLHGGGMNVDRERENVVGIEINGNHLRGKRDGMLTAVATPVHVGRSTHVWDVRITDEQGKAVCISRCTLAVVPAVK